MTPLQLTLTFLGISSTAVVFKICIGMTWSKTLTIFGASIAGGAILGLVIAVTTGLWRP